MWDVVKEALPLLVDMLVTFPIGSLYRASAAASAMREPSGPQVNHSLARRGPDYPAPPDYRRSMAIREHDQKLYTSFNCPLALSRSMVACEVPASPPARS